MLFRIFKFELKYRAIRPATYIYFILMAALSYLLVLAAGQFFSSGEVSIGGIDGNVLINSPFIIHQLISAISFFGVLIIAAIMGNPVLRDFEHETHTLLYTYPISKISYLGGRYLGSFVITLLVLSGIAVGFFLGTITPGVNEEKFGAFHLIYYLYPYLILIIPNTIFIGSIFFSLATLTRNVLSTYLGSVLFLVLYIIASSFMEDIENETISALIDPFGGFAVDTETKYWSVAQKNSTLIPFSGLILWNRLIWLCAGLGIFSLTYFRFRFSHFLNDKRRKALASKAAESKSSGVVEYDKLILPTVETSHGSFANLKKWWMLFRFEFSQILRSVYFQAIVFAGLIVLIANSTQVGQMYGTTTYPVTYQVISLLSGSFNLFFIIIITFYAGELIWRDRAYKVDELRDSLPISSWITYSSKLLSLIGIQFILLVVILLCGIGVQTAMGYYNYEFHQYFASLFGQTFIDLALLCVFVMFIQVIVNHKFLGYFIIVVYYLFDMFLRNSIGMEHDMFDYGGDPGSPYSDMNGYGHYIWPFYAFKIYWMAFAIILAVLSNLFWVRGKDAAFKSRLAMASMKWKNNRKAMLTGIILFFISGAYIYYNTNILNDFETSKERIKERADYEKKYSKYEGIPQPRITDVNINLDIYPEKRDFYFNGYYKLENKTNKVIDSIHINLPGTVVINDLSFDRSTVLVSSDANFGYFIYKFDKPLLPGEKTILSIDIGYETHGFKLGGTNTSIVYNGSFINSNYLPSIGYNESAELSSEDDRKKHDLPPKDRMPRITNEKARNNNYISNDADWINFETTISTSADQYAIAPGYLQKEWTTDNRRYFHYKMDGKILNFYSFLSAKYEVHRDKWKDVNIEIYYHKGHEYNVDKMTEAIKKSLDYYTKNFSPYQHKQVRIIEFPRYSSFAQSFPNTIPYSESIGFIAKVDTSDDSDLDYPFYVTAHEVAHQWWAHQVIGANVQGATVMSETMSQYSALMVMKKEYGEKNMKRFLEYEMDQYLSSRGSERKKELPLILNENQGYIHYKKGSVVMYALQDYIGEDSLNKALSAYIHKVGFQEPPYTTSLEFLSYIKSVTPDSLSYLIKDMFETITFYENKITEATYKELDSNLFEVQLVINSKKTRSDSLGNEKEVDMNDWIDVGVFGREKIDGKWEDTELYFKKHKLHSGDNTITVTTAKKPQRAGVDPYHKLIDKHLEDNTTGVKEVDPTE